MRGNRCKSHFVLIHHGVTECEIYGSTKPSVSFVGRRPRPDASDQDLHCLLTGCVIKILVSMKNTAQQPFKRKLTGPIDAWEFHSI